ncbi:hypothetical protein F4778DRAFT_781641 [Xylariomycetidae sp. FL2044]|nr:hypothetical protein F4778DRAFT_781641 [Xylariomycetidae sp. FL2044]
MEKSTTDQQQQRRSQQIQRTAEEELKKRRERGKVAQREFRKRQAKASEHMRDENATLKAAIRSIAQAVRAEDRAELRKVIGEAAGAAGLDLVDYLGDYHGAGEMQERNGDATRQQEQEQEQQQEQHDTSRSSVDFVFGASRSLTDSSTGMVYEVTSSVQDEISASLVPSKQHIQSADDYIIADHMVEDDWFRQELSLLSPQLNSRLWFNPLDSIRIVDPPTDIIPYLGENKRSLGGLLVYACGKSTIELCRQATCTTIGYRQSRSAQRRLYGLIQHSRPMRNIRFIRAMAEVRLQFRDSGYGEGGNPAGDADSAELLQKLVEEDFRRRGVDTKVWWNAKQVERHVRMRLGTYEFARLNHALRYVSDDEIEVEGIRSTSGEWQRAWSEEAEEDLIPMIQLGKTLIKKLAESYICFGDGPRWKGDRIAATLLDLYPGGMGAI